MHFTHNEMEFQFDNYFTGNSLDYGSHVETTIKLE